MIFSSPLFLFLFLPVVLTIYVVLPGIRIRNLWLLLMSLGFYAWGQVDFLLLLLASTAVNYGLGLWVDREQDTGRRKLAVALAILVNVGLLAFFKYADFAVGLINDLMKFAGRGQLPPPHITLPLGISFFTFHALSYIIDIYRRKWPAARDPRNVALYIFFFPQLIAGPILRWSAIGPQLLQRTMSQTAFAEGVRRFVGGLAKKVLIANSLAGPADQIFALPVNELSLADAWIGILCYTLQIYFDFSGYSDMAIGLGKMFGFEFMENFQFPYVAPSIRNFWQRWHISLSTWFRDYVYIPLGGNRRSEARTYFNLVIVFLLCGLWHGASLTFVVWGLYHGCFLALERTRWGKIQERLPRTLRHLYALLVVMMGWVIFRADTFSAAGNYFQALFGLSHAAAAQNYDQYLTNQTLLALFFGILLSGRTGAGLRTVYDQWLSRVPAAGRTWLSAIAQVGEFSWLAALFVISAVWLASGTYNPFIYFRF